MENQQNWLKRKIPILNKIKIRPLSYVYNSRVDFIDAWISVLTILTGIILITNDPIENLPIYQSLIQSRNKL